MGGDPEWASTPTMTEAMKDTIPGYTPLEYTPEPSDPTIIETETIDEWTDFPDDVRNLFITISKIDVGEKGKRVLLKSTLEAIISSISPGFSFEKALSTQENSTSFIENGVLSYYLYRGDDRYLVTHGEHVSIKKVKP